jgi:SAM-dependent methyltransferase
MTTSLPATEQYIPGPTENAIAFMAARDLESHGFFLEPFLERGRDVLDVGCGPGTITAGLAEAVLPGRVTGLDVAPAQLSRARRMVEGREILNVEFLAGSAYQLPFADEAFDLTFAHALIEHLNEPHAALAEFRRVTKRGGVIALCSPDWDAFELHPFPVEIQRAIESYRELQEANGGNTRAGGLLPTWLSDAAIPLIVRGDWDETYEDATSIAEYLARQLDTAGSWRDGDALRHWAHDPEAWFRQSWKYAIGRRIE